MWTVHGFKNESLNVRISTKSLKFQHARSNLGTSTENQQKITASFQHGCSNPGTQTEKQHNITECFQHGRSNLGTELKIFESFQHPTKFCHLFFCSTKSCHLFFCHTKSCPSFFCPTESCPPQSARKFESRNRNRNSATHGIFSARTFKSRNRNGICAAV